MIHLHHMQGFSRTGGHRFVHFHNDAFEEHPGVNPYTVLVSVKKAPKGMLVHFVADTGYTACGKPAEGWRDAKGDPSCRLCFRLVVSAPTI